MKQLKFVFLAVFILCLISCEKEQPQLENLESDIDSFEELQEHLLQNKSSEIKSFFSFTIADGFNEYLIPRVGLRSDKELLEAAAVNLFNQNKDFDFIPYMLNNVGIPVWSRAYIDENNLSVSIPFIDNTNSFTKAFLVGKTEESSDQFLFHFVERRYLNLTIPAEVDELEKIKLMISHDLDLFDEHDDTLYPYYEENKLKDSEGQIQTRTCYEHIEVCECVWGYALKSKEKSTSRNCPEGYDYDCYTVTVPVDCGNTGTQVGNGNCIGCTGNEGNVSEPIGVISGGSDTDLNPTFFENIEMLQNCVFAGNNDIDVDGEVGGINEGLAGELCESWNYYKKRCLSDEFDGVPLLSLPYNQQPNYQSNPYYIWGSYSATNPGLFDEIMNMDYGCVTSDQLELAEDVADAFDDFVGTYGLDLTDSQKKAIKKAAMDNVGWSEEAAKDILLQQYDTIFSEDDKAYIKTNFIIFNEVDSFLGLHSNESESKQNLSKSIASAYVKLLKDENLTDLTIDLGDVGNFDDPYWEIAKDLILESVKELLIDLIPGGTLATIGPEVLNSVQSGNWMDAMYGVADIILNEADAIFPAAKVVSFSAGLFVTGKQLKKAFEAFKKAKKLGEDFLLKLYDVFTKKLGWDAKDIRKKFRSIEGIGAKIDGVVGSDFLMKLKEVFPAELTSILDLPSPPKSGLPFWKISDLPANKSVYMISYPVSSQNFFTIKFYIGNTNSINSGQLSQKFALRFDL